MAKDTQKGELTRKKVFKMSRRATNKRSSTRNYAPTKSAPENSDTEIDDISGEGTYEVDAIRGKKLDDDNQIFYLVKWKGYNSPTWEPEALCSCDTKIQDYERMFGVTTNGKSTTKENSRASLLADSRSVSRSRTKSTSPNNDSTDSARSTRNRRAAV